MTLCGPNYFVQSKGTKKRSGRVNDEGSSRVPAMPAVALPNSIAMFKGEDEIEYMEEPSFGRAERECGWV